MPPVDLPLVRAPILHVFSRSFSSFVSAEITSMRRVPTFFPPQKSNRGFLAIGPHAGKLAVDAPCSYTVNAFLRYSRRNVRVTHLEYNNKKKKKNDRAFISTNALRFHETRCSGVEILLSSRRTPHQPKMGAVPFRDYFRVGGRCAKATESIDRTF